MNKAVIPTIDEILSSSYQSVEAPPKASIQNSALLLIDIQHMATPDYLWQRATQAGLDAKGTKEALLDYSNRFQAALDQCHQLLQAARQSGIPPIHVKIQALSASARDTGALHRRLGWTFPPGAKPAEFLPEVEPAAGEIVITKTASGGFSGTNLDATLRNMGIEHLFVCGFVTDECVETTVRVALDLGYIASIVRDATTTYHEDMYHHVIRKFSSFGLVQQSSDIMEVFKKMGSL